MILENFFDELHFTESKIESYRFFDQTLYINFLSGLYLFEDHPWKGILKKTDRSTAIFKNVVYSHRILDLYSEDRQSFKGTKKILDVDILNRPKAKSFQRFSLEGVLNSPASWVTWDIDATAFFLEIDDKLLSSLPSIIRDNSDLKTHLQPILHKEQRDFSV